MRKLRYVGSYRIKLQWINWLYHSLDKVGWQLHGKVMGLTITMWRSVLHCWHQYDGVTYFITMKTCTTYNDNHLVINMDLSTIRSVLFQCHQGKVCEFTTAALASDPLVY